MPNRNTPAAAIEDVWVDHPNGRMFARTWSPLANSSRAAAESPIVLFHDSLGSVDLWRSFPAALSSRTGRRVIAYDRLGFGRSARRSGTLGLDFVSEEAETYFPAVRERLGLTRMIGFGHSVGGGMVLSCAARFPEQFDAVITESTQAFVEDRTVQGILDEKERFERDGLLERLRKYHGDKATWVFEAWTGTWLRPDFVGWSLKPILPRVACPLLVIHGARDEYGSARHPEMIAELSGGPSRVEIILGAHHLPHREREQTVVDLVAAFLASMHDAHPA